MFTSKDDMFKNNIIALKTIKLMNVLSMSNETRCSDNLTEPSPSIYRNCCHLLKDIRIEKIRMNEILLSFCTKMNQKTLDQTFLCILSLKQICHKHQPFLLFLFFDFEGKYFVFS